MNRTHRRHLQALLVHPDAARRAQGRELLGALPRSDQIDLVRWLLSPRRRLGRGVLGATGRPLIELPGADLRGLDLSSHSAQGADLRGADLRGALLECASFRDADLREARLDAAAQSCLDLSGADLRGATGIDRAECWYDAHTRWM